MRVEKKISTRDLTFMGSCIAFLAICSWITIPATIPFTLQTMGVFLTLYVLGGMKGTMTIIGYLLLGCVGVPVFAGFQGGISALFGLTGGYLLGFIGTGAVYWIMETLFGKSMVNRVISLVLGLFVCYLFGTLWFVRVYSAGSSSIGFFAALSMCVLPFIVFDIAKLVIAVIVGRKINAIVQNAQ